MGFIEIDGCALLSKDIQCCLTAKRAGQDWPRHKATFVGVVGLLVSGVVGLLVLGSLVIAGAAAHI